MATMDSGIPVGPDFPLDDWLRGAVDTAGGLPPGITGAVNWLTLRHARRAAEKALLPFAETLEDRDILDAIGAYAEMGKPCTYKELRHADIAAPATLQRRLRRLVSLGAVTQLNSTSDRRYRHLALTDATTSALTQLERDSWAEMLRVLRPLPQPAAGT